jgi:hypothetical protein
MRPVLIVSGVLGSGTVLVFALAALVSTMFPSGTLVGASWNGGVMGGGGFVKGGPIVAPVQPVPMPAPGVVQPGIVIQNDVQVFPTSTDGDTSPQP